MSVDAHTDILFHRMLAFVQSVAMLSLTGAERSSHASPLAASAYHDDHAGMAMDGHVSAKGELVQKKIIPQATYDKIKNQILAKQK